MSNIENRVTIPAMIGSAYLCIREGVEKTPGDDVSYSCKKPLAEFAVRGKITKIEKISKSDQALLDFLVSFFSIAGYSTAYFPSGNADFN